MGLAAGVSNKHNAMDMLRFFGMVGDATERFEKSITYITVYR